jgi:hypothetical protein
MSLEQRVRLHEEPHVRTIERQILDVLLRIEEILERAHPQPTSITAKVLGKGRK